MRQLEHVVLDVLRDLGLQGESIPGLTGVWMEGCKVAAIGVGCRRWITQHGLALNVDCELQGFAEITPCGLVGHPVGRPLRSVARADGERCAAFASPVPCRTLPPGVDPAGVIRLC